MKTVYSDKQRLHAIKTEMSNGKIEPCYEKPSRAKMVLDRVKETKLGDVINPEDYGTHPLTKVHTSAYVDFLKNFWPRWIAGGGNPEQATPYCFPARHLTNNRPPELIDGQLGYYSFDTAASLNEGSWEAIYAAAQCALTAQKRITNGENSLFALCRPPGHHASSDVMGGYCYINNAAVAAQAFLDDGAKRVAIVDVDYHHGNGTQSIFYKRSDVFFASVHADPAYDYPHFLGYADETGSHEGLGWNMNCPLPTGHKTDWKLYESALVQCLKKIKEHQSEVLIVSLGLDTFEHDPISSFRLKTDDYLKMGSLFANINLPTLFVFEGGYAVEDLGMNCVNVLQGFENNR
jgi:acetoin utilization deacetylase AcuC-like enzyme